MDTDGFIGQLDMLPQQFGARFPDTFDILNTLNKPHPLHHTDLKFLPAY